jgi:hypothetical protein
MSDIVSGSPSRPMPAPLSPLLRLRSVSLCPSFSDYFLHRDLQKSEREASLTAKPIKSGYQSHYVVVSMPHGDAAVDPSKLGQASSRVADEFVVAGSNQIFGKYMLKIDLSALQTEASLQWLAESFKAADAKLRCNRFKSIAFVK